MTQVIGFASEFYTLWNKSTREVWNKDTNGNTYLSGVYTDYTYIKNISTDLAKAKTLHPGVEVDDTLRGKSGSFSLLGEPIGKAIMPIDVFPYGKLKWSPIAIATDAWQLNRLMLDKDANKYSRLIARKRLIELGELVKYNKVWMKRKDAEIAKLAKGRHFTEGAKVELNIFRIEFFSYQTQFGTIYVEVYGSECGRLFKYKGANPPAISDDTFTRIKATVKHGEYNGAAETLLQRIKVI